MIKYTTVKTILIVLLIIFNLAAHSQQNNTKFEDLTAKLGLSYNFISKMQQDRQGYLWISTFDNGLIKYDGYTASGYLYHPFDPQSLAQNQIYTFYFGKNDAIWIGTPEGLCQFDPSTEKFTRYDSTLITGMPDLGNVSAITEDDQGHMWIGNFEGKLWRYNRQKNEFLSFTSKLSYKQENSLSTNFHENISALHKDKKGTIWIGNTTGLHRVDIQAGQNGKADKISFKHYQHDPSETNSLSGNEITNIYEDKKGLIWIVAFGVINSFNPATEIFTRYPQDPDDPFSFNAIIGWGSWMVEDYSGNLWIASNNGLFKLNKEQTKFIPYSQNKQINFGLSSNYIYAVGVDAGSNLLVGTSKGLQRLDLDPKAFGMLQVDSLSRSGLRSNNITAILEGRSGHIWIGTYGGGLNKWDRKNGVITNLQHKPGDPRSLQSNNVHAILEDDDGSLWICNEEYLSHLNMKEGSFENYNSNSRNLSDWDAKNIYSICKDRDGLIWLGTGNGIKRFDPATRKFKHYFYEQGNPYGISDYTAMAILADSHGNIWVGTNSIAFNKFDKKTERFTHFENNALDSTSISSNIVNCLFEDSKGKLWIGTSGGGVCWYNNEKQKFYSPGRNKQNSWNSVFSIQEDNEGNIWMGTNMGLSCYNTNKDEFVNYVEQDGLQGNYFATTAARNNGSSAKSKDGILYFGGHNGLNYFNPSLIHANKYIPPVVITQFKIFDKLQPGKNQDSVITLNYNQNFFSFEFAALNFTNSSKNKYAYQLEGFDPEWIYSDSRRYAGYTNLGPGEYLFKVKGSNNDGVWNEKGITVKLIILPPWWRTWWAYAVYGLLLISGIWAVDRYQKRRVILSEREKSQKKELAQAKEIEKAYRDLKTTQSQLIQSEKMASLGELTAGIAHEIQNPLNFVNNFSELNRELITEMKEEMRAGHLSDAEEIATNIQENEEKINHHGKRADAIVKSMLQHSHSSSGAKEPVDINEMADEYLRLAYHGLRAKEKSFHADFSSTLDPAVGKLNIVSQDIGRVLLNLINNAFYAVNEKANNGIPGYEPYVLLTTKRAGNKVEIFIKDNGEGIPESIQKKIFQPFFTTKPTGIGTGLGLSLSYDIVKAHGGEIKVESKEGEGSVFTVCLPT